MGYLACTERVEVFREADGQWVRGTRVSGATLQSLRGVVGRGAYGVLYDDGQSELVRAAPRSVSSWEGVGLELHPTQAFGTYGVLRAAARPRGQQAVE